MDYSKSLKISLVTRINFVLFIAKGTVKPNGLKFIKIINVYILGPLICFEVGLSFDERKPNSIFLQGVTWPAMHSLSAHWIPATERSKFMVSYHGTSTCQTNVKIIIQIKQLCLNKFKFNPIGSTQFKFEFSISSYYFQYNTSR